MREYLKMLEAIKDRGELKENRTGIDTYTIVGYMFQHNMAEGFPLLTTKKMAKKTMLTELEGFIKGVTDKNWYKERGANLWNEWCNPEVAPYASKEDIDGQKAMAECNDLGPIYGYQWSRFGETYKPVPQITTPFSKDIVLTGPIDGVIGETFESNNSGSFQPILREGSNDQGHALYTIQFEKTGYCRHMVRLDVIKKGNVKDPYAPSVCGVAGMGQVPDTSLYKQELYKCWSHMIERCYKEPLVNI